MDIFGRSAELAALRRTIDRAPGAPGNLVLHGDPGVGKSVLLQAGIAYAREQGLRVIGGAGYESEAQLAFAGLHQLFAPVMRYLDAVEPYHRQVLRRVLGFEPGAVPDRLAIAVATLAAVAAVAEDGPVLIAVEDAHWVDVPTREVMMFLLMRLESYDIRAIFARRPLAATERVTPGINMVEVPPLDDLAAAELLGHLHPELPQHVRQRVMATSAGNPLALTELAAALGTDAATGLELLPDTAPLRTRLEGTYASRVLALPPEQRRCLLLTALDGDRLENRAQQAHPHALSPHWVADFERLGLVTRDSTPSGLRFRHPLVRSAIVHSASPDEVRSAHGELAASYADLPERRMWHLAAATVESDEAVAAEIEAAAHAVSRRGGSGLAVPALQRAAALSPQRADGARRLQHAAELAGDAGRLGQAQELAEEARRYLDDPAQSCRSLLTKARILLLRDGDLAGARRLIGQVLRQGDLAGSDGGLDLQALRLRVLGATYAQDPEEWAEVADLLAKSGAGWGTPPDPGATLSPGSPPHAGVPPETPWEPLIGGPLTEERLREAFDVLPPEAPAARVVELCYGAAALDQLHHYRDHVRELIRQESGQGAVTHAAAGHWFAALDHFLAGSWDEAESVASAGLDLCIRHELALAAHDLRCTLGWLAAARGDAESAREYGRVVDQWAQPRGSRLHLALTARNLALAAIAEGDYETAYTHCVRVGPPGVIETRGGFAPWAILDLVDSALHTGRTAEAEAHVEAAVRVGLREVSPRLRLQILAARALAADDDQEAVALFRQALALPCEHWSFDHARVRLAFGELHRRRHRPGEARPELRRAADIFGRIGATAWQRRAEQELRASGVAVGLSRTTGEPAAAADLTAQQLEVANLAASGLSNKEIAERLFLSPRTVSAHLYRVFPKLGITSRSALRDALASAGLTNAG
ncbi:helix-turn-helix transcriptional regulator [Streptomyces sp.]|uniref:helix-turn-helix transcriptional regulator n=1 Tax=Streptomyces sp. TaxID=1931 RepID=UPI002F4105AE